MRYFGLIGKPLEHSFSKSFFNAYFSKHAIKDATFINFEIDDVSELSALVESYPNLLGLSVTYPFKEQVIAFLNETDRVAQQIGAVNCIHIQNKQLKGYNTDYIGFQKSIRPFLSPHHQPALILGTGGASKAIQHALKNLNWPFTLVSRNPTQKNILHYSELKTAHIEHFKFIINTSPLGMGRLHEQCPTIPYEGIGTSHFVMDLIYNPETTLFLLNAQKQGAEVLNGYDMLKFQALESWGIWNTVS